MSGCPSTYDECWQWMMERVGTVIYRGPAWPDAKAPDLANPAAIRVMDVNHAEYLCDCAMEMDVRYFDEPQTT